MTKEKQDMQVLIAARNHASSKKKAASLAITEACKPMQAQLEAAEKEMRSLEEQIHNTRRELLEEHVEVLLLLRPEHDRATCSDSEVKNTEQCVRCALLELRDHGHLDDGTDIVVTATFDNPS